MVKQYANAMMQNARNQQQEIPQPFGTSHEPQRQGKASTPLNIQTPLSSLLSGPESGRMGLGGKDIGSEHLRRTLLKKIHEIREYSGQIKDDAAREYLRDCERFFDEVANLALTPVDDRTRVLTARGALTDKARRKWLAYDQRVQAGDAVPIETWQKYQDWINHEFSEHLGSEKRWDKFFETKQGPHQTFADYAANLRQAAVETESNLPEAVVIQRLRKGAKVELQKEWAKDSSQPTTLDAVVNRFIQYERGAMIARHVER